MMFEPERPRCLIAISVILLCLDGKISVIIVIIRHIDVIHEKVLIDVETVERVQEVALLRPPIAQSLLLLQLEFLTISSMLNP